MFTRDNPYPTREWQRNIQHNYEKMRRVVLDRYDKVWVVESDTIPPVDALEKLLEIEADVVSGLYAMRHGNPCPNLMRYSKTLRGLGGTMRWGELDGLTMEISGGCMGCVVIDRKTMGDFSFIRNDLRPPDGPFMEHCLHKFKQIARLDVVCLHKQPDGTILDPNDYLSQRSTS